MALRDDLVQLFQLTGEAAQAPVRGATCPRLYDWLAVMLGRDPGLLTLRHPRVPSTRGTGKTHILGVMGQLP